MASPGSGRTGTVAALLGGLMFLAGLFALGRLAAWFAQDMGWTGSGARLDDPWAAALPALAATVALAAGIAVVLRRHRVVGRAQLMALIGVTVVALLGVGLAVHSYPRITSAHLVAIDPATHTVAWRVDLPLTTVFGLRSATTERLVIEGVIVGHSCESNHLSVTLDRTTGEILAVEDLPTFYDDQSQVPPPPTALDPTAFDVEQGATPFVCRG